MSKLSYEKFDPSWSINPIPPIPECSISQILTDSAKKWPDKVALVCLGKEMTYSELDDLSSRLASQLANKFGIKKGDTVSTLLPNSIQATISFFAINKIGAVGAPCNVMYTERELGYQLNDASVETIIALDMFYPLVSKVKDETPLKNIIITKMSDFADPENELTLFLSSQETEFPGAVMLTDLLSQPVTPLPDPHIDIDRDLALILYTAGTTGVPKGVMESHRIVWAACCTFIGVMGLGEDDVNLQLMPMFHCSGFVLLQLPTLMAGGTVVLIPMFDATQCLEQMTKYKVTAVAAPPTFYIALVNHPDIKKYDLTNCRFTAACGAPTPFPILGKWNEMTTLDLVDGLGLTELMCGSIVSGGIVNLPKKGKVGAIGVPISEVKIVNDAGEVVPRGESGEMMFLFKGDFVRGYLNKPEETKKSWSEDGWFRTGDVAYMDDEGFVFFVDRCKDLIIASGYNIAPAEIEAVIMKHPAVFESAVIGIPDGHRGETVKVFVSLLPDCQGDVTEEELIEFCRKDLATFKVPRFAEIIDVIPKNLVGKILRRELRDREAAKET